MADVAWLYGDAAGSTKMAAALTAEVLGAGIADLTALRCCARASGWIPPPRGPLPSTWYARRRPAWFGESDAAPVVSQAASL